MIVEWSKPDITQEEINAGIISLKTHIGANGPNIELFEKEFAEKVNSKYAIAVNNGTTALMTSLMCFRELYGPDKTIGVPSFTFIASANSAKTFYDNVELLECDKNTWNIKSEYIKNNIDLLMSVDVGGLSCDYDDLKSLNIPIISDSAESMGSTYKNEVIGSQCDIHCFSLHTAKIITAGEGGMITTNNSKIMELCKSLMNHGYSKDKKSYEYRHDTMGLNFRMTDIQAAIARVQLKKLDSYVEHRNKVASIYKDEFKNINGISVQEFGNDYKTKRRIRVIPQDKDAEPVEFMVPKGKLLSVQEGDFIRKGDLIIDGSPVPHDILNILGVEALANYLVKEVQDVYRLQGVKINDKHIEVIVRQMLQKIEIVDHGDTTFLNGEHVNRSEFKAVNDKVLKENKNPAKGNHVLLGITKASLQTDSFISAASFQETTRVLTEAAVSGKTDSLLGLKENVIVGRLVPAGTGSVINKFRGIAVQRDKKLLEEAKSREDETLSEQN